MIRSIKVTDEKIRDILLFESIDKLKRLNILFGGNGVGKTTFLNALRDGKLELETDKDIIIMSYTNSIHNARANKNIKPQKGVEFLRAYNANSCSEGKSIAHYALSFLYDIEEMDTDKDIVVLMDEIDSGLSAENTNMLLWKIKELLDTKNVQIFILTNHYHYAYTVGTVLSMYNGKYLYIKSYEEYISLLNQGIEIMKKSKM